MKHRADDERWMRLALRRARRGEGLTRPNPPVGAVVVSKGRLIASGHHPIAGKPHAEALALRRAGSRAAGATLYVTLEPCCTWGRQPPCTDAILLSGVRRVVVATADPNPRHRGRGLRILRRAGLEVVTGVCAVEARELIEPFARRIVTGCPHLMLKMAMTFDGKIADHRGRSRWITSAPARSIVQDLRRRSDAILVGAGTVCTDNPSLLPRPDRGRRPWRVVVDSRGRVSAEARIFTDGAADRTIVATTERCPPTLRQAWERSGATVWVCRASAGRVSLPDLMRKLGRLGVMQVLCEGGGELAASVLDARLVDEAWFFVAPDLLGGPGGRPVVGGADRPLSRKTNLSVRDVRRVGRDWLFRMRIDNRKG